MTWTRDTEILLRVRDYDLAATLDSGQVFRWRRAKRFLDRRRRPTLGAADANARRHPRRNRRAGRRLAMAPRFSANRNGFGRRAQNFSRRRADARTPSPRAADCACCARNRGNASRRSFCPPPNKSSKSGKSLRCSANDLASGLRRGHRIVKRLAITHFQRRQKSRALTEAELRACKMGFRAPHLLAAARQIAEGKFDLERPRRLPLAEARAELMKLRGVGGKIADCVLLFAYGFDSAFPVDVWVERALRQLYFPRRRVTAKAVAPFCRDAFRPARRLRPAISFSLHADEDEIAFP